MQNLRRPKNVLHFSFGSAHQSHDQSINRQFGVIQSGHLSINPSIRQSRVTQSGRSEAVNPSIRQSVNPSILYQSPSPATSATCRGVITVGLGRRVLLLGQGVTHAFSASTRIGVVVTLLITIHKVLWNGLRVPFGVEGITLILNCAHQWSHPIEDAFLSECGRSGTFGNFRLFDVRVALSFMLASLRRCGDGWPVTSEDAKCKRGRKSKI